MSNLDAVGPSQTEIANAKTVTLSLADVERFSFSLPAEEAQKLRQAAQNSSISKKVREALKTQFYLDDQIAAGGSIYVKTGDGELLKLVFEA
ncbi:MAG: hypothetical protein AAGF93_04015 [Cyanobacteria bacterium P01_H01_bin.105]